MKKRYSLFIVLTITCIFCKGQPWTRITSLPKANIFSLELHGNTLYAGSADKVYTGVSNGTTWTASASLGNVGAVLTATPFNNKLFAGTHTSGVFSSGDGGQSWQAVNNGLGLLSVSKLVSWKGHLYAGTQGVGVYVFNETNNTWSAFNNNFSPNVDGVIRDLVATDSTLFAAAGANGILHRYNPATGIWDEAFYKNRLSAGLIVLQLVIEGNTLFAGSPFAVTLFRSDDLGNVWAPDDNGVLGDGTPAFTIGNDKHYLSVSSFENGINLVRFYERDKAAATGSVWNKTDSISKGFFYNIVYAGTRIYAATDSGLLYKELSPTPVANISTFEKAAIKIFPNPSTGAARITFHFAIPQKVSVQLLDAGGKLVAILLNQQQVGNGEQVLPIDLNRLSDGIYLINITIAGTQQTQKLVVHH